MMDDQEFADYLTEWLIHQLPAPGTQSSNYFAMIARRVREREDVRPELIDMANHLEGYSDRLGDVVKEMQKLRVKYRSPSGLTPDQIGYSLKYFAKIAEATSKEFSALLKTASGKEIQVELHDQIRRCRRKLEQFRRMTRALELSATMQIEHDEAAVLELSYHRIVEFAAEEAWDQHEQEFDFKKNIELNTRISKNKAFSDYDKITEVFYNLFDNSVKYHPFSPKLRVFISMEKTNPGQLKKNWSRLIVGEGVTDLILVFYRDNGQGVPRDIRERIFERGFRGKYARENKIKGGGFGLSYCRKVLRGLGGDIICIYPSSNTNGAEFVFCFPLHLTVNSFWELAKRYGQVPTESS